MPKAKKNNLNEETDDFKLQISKVSVFLEVKLLFPKSHLVFNPDFTIHATMFTAE